MLSQQKRDGGQALAHHTHCCYDIGLGSKALNLAEESLALLPLCCLKTSQHKG